MFPHNGHVSEYFCHGGRRHPIGSTSLTASTRVMVCLVAKYVPNFESRDELFHFSLPNLPPYHFSYLGNVLVESCTVKRVCFYNNGKRNE